jgi:hypothetical protein
VKPINITSMEQVQRRNILRRGKRVTTTAAMLAPMRPQHWLATVLLSVVAYEEREGKRTVDSRLRVGCIVSNHSEECRKVVRDECVS